MVTSLQPVPANTASLMPQTVAQLIPARHYQAEVMLATMPTMPGIILIQHEF